MKLVRQRDPLGCAVACFAFTNHISYQQARKIFVSIKNIDEGYCCRDIVLAYHRIGKHARFNYLKSTLKKKIYKNDTIVFIKRSALYPFGHFLVKADKGWMDPWINWPDCQNFKKAKAGFRKKLPGVPIYAVWVISPDHRSFKKS